MLHRSFLYVNKILNSMATLKNEQLLGFRKTFERKSKLHIDFDALKKDELRT